MESYFLYPGHSLAVPCKLHHFFIRPSIHPLPVPAVVPVAPGYILSLQILDEPPVLLTCPGLMKPTEPGQRQTQSMGLVGEK